MTLDVSAILENHRLFAEATATGDPERAASLCRPDAVVWHNYDNAEIPYADTAKSLLWLHKKVPDIAWVTRFLLTTPTGWVWLATITGSAPGGPLSAQTCMVATLDDAGLIRRLDEYIDPSQMGPVRAASLA